MQAPASDRLTLAAGAGLALLGGALFVATVVFGSPGATLPAAVLGRVLPAALAAFLVVAGGWLARSDCTGAGAVRVLAWVAVGLGITGVMAISSIAYELLVGADQARPVIHVIGNLAAGGVAGFLIGVYNVRSRRRARQLAAERERLDAQREKLELLNQIVRHDVRNDLTVIDGMAELADPHVAPEGDEYLAKIQRAARNAIELTETARDFVEVLHDDDEQAFEPRDIGQVVRTQVEHTREVYPHATVEIDGELPTVAVEADQLLSSVFRNLLTNAVHHGGEDEPSVTVSGRLEGGWVRVAVADRGRGVPDGQKETIFGRGEKGLDSAGTGIGLYLVDMLVTAYGGDVWVEDNEPTGAVFVVRLPVADA